MGRRAEDSARLSWTETPMGLEPIVAGLQPAASPRWLQRRFEIGQSGSRRDSNPDLGLYKAVCDPSHSMSAEAREGFEPTPRRLTTGRSAC